MAPGQRISQCRQSEAHPEICEYTDSSKYLAYKGEFSATQRVDTNLDDWGGEA